MRICKHIDNQKNQKLSTKNSSGYRGVSFYKNKWRATITINKDSIFLGCYDTPEEAAKRYDEVSIMFHGEFGKTNYPIDRIKLQGVE